MPARRQAPPNAKTSRNAGPGSAVPQLPHAPLAPRPPHPPDPPLAPHESNASHRSLAPQAPTAPVAPTAAPKESAPARAMKKLGLVRDIDLALHLPLRYEDETRLTPIGTLAEGDAAQVEGEIRDCRVEHSRTRRHLVARVRDASGELVLRWLNFYPSQQKQLATGRRVRVRGEVRGGFLGLEIVHPVLKVVEPGAPLPTTLTPVYPASAQLPQAYLRKVVESALRRVALDELLPADVAPPGLPSLRESILALHHPAPGVPMSALEDRTHPAWQRLKFDELLAQQLSQAFAQAERARLRAPPLQANGVDHLRAKLAATLPFVLTRAQQRVVAEIERDLALDKPMHRLLQGDVGSGKTVVAALAAATAISAGWQCALMAPTEILAEQHFRKLVGWLEPLGVGVAWLTGSRKGRARQAMLGAVASGEAALVVGTHAVIQDDVHFARLGLAVVDEQHRFGVEQRLALRAKLGAHGAGSARSAAPAGREAAALEPHLLMMSATPIPRTLAMTYFADLDISTLDELPPGRTPVVTKVFADDKRAQVIARIRDELARGVGRQVYWVCPLIEESESAEGSASQALDAGPTGMMGRSSGRRPPADLQNATDTHAELSAALPGTMVGLLHGRMPAAEKAAVMSLFTEGQMRVLVATTVIEVGVDVPAASLMVIEHAERFGLAQLHQLRGRVGRGTAASVCVLLYTAPLSPTAKERLRALAETNDGFEIARRDLEIRGPGEFMGARQSGDALLRFADLGTDAALLARAREMAPRLLRESPEAAAQHVARWLGSRSDYLKA
ncbi:MAG: ATP-dependent DNA helicase RecG [Rubrivivax sp.]|nr:ATP-dependent DNA helicase RecG [Rubrivivax sp.]